MCDDFLGDLNAKVNELITDAGKAARAAVEQRPARTVLVAGCLPPLAESYRADRVVSFEDNVAQYTLIAESIAPYSASSSAKPCRQRTRLALPPLRPPRWESMYGYRGLCRSTSPRF